MKIIFIHIPKTAGYTIGRCLRDAGALCRGKEGCDTTRYGFSHRTAQECLKKEDYAQHPMMAVVRNPYDRLYSIHQFFTQARGDIPPDVSLEQFILNFESSPRGGSDCNPSWSPSALPQENPSHLANICRPCFRFISDGAGNPLACDILKFENLKQQYDLFCKKYNIKNNLIIRNSNPTKKIPADPQQLYSPEMRAIVERVFKDDFKYFNYSYNSFIAQGVFTPDTQEPLHTENHRTIIESMKKKY